MLFSQDMIPPADVRAMSPRLLAYIGDAVFHLFEREREIMSASTASQMHRNSTKRASAKGQADLLDIIESELSAEEADIVRRARNLKSPQRRANQAEYRRATAFEALVGFLYLTDAARLQRILERTVTSIKAAE